MKRPVKVPTPPPISTATPRATATRDEGDSIHASAVLVGARAVLVRGPSGAGKSRLVSAVLDAAAAGRMPFARLVADDRTQVRAVNGRLLVRPPAALEGMLELRGIGLRRVPFEPAAVVGLVVDLAAADAERMPAAEAQSTVIGGISLPRLAVAPGNDPLPLVLGWLMDAGGRSGDAKTGLFPEIEQSGPNAVR